MRKIFLIVLMGMLVNLFAASVCVYSIDKSRLTWTAFKTPLKIGVKGTFDDIKLKFDNSKTKKELLKSSRAKIFTYSVDSKNKARDAKLIKYFFEVQGVKTIDAKIINVDKNRVDVEIEMNHIKRVVPMKVKYSKDKISLKGYIDLADFKMLPSLKSITKACYNLHQGKTWQDIELNYEIYTSCK